MRLPMARQLERALVTKPLQEVATSKTGGLEAAASCPRSNEVPHQLLTRATTRNLLPPDLLSSTQLLHRFSADHHRWRGKTNRRRAIEWSGQVWDWPLNRG